MSITRSPDMNNAPLSQAQRDFAEANHGLLLAFMTRHNLDGEFYDRLSLRYLHTVVRYMTEIKLQQYAFSTVLWYHLRSELSNILRDNRKFPGVPDYSASPSRDPTYDHAVDAELWKEIERELTFKQCEAVLLRNQGYKNREIAELCGVQPKAIEKRFGRIRKKLKTKGY